MRRIYYLAMAVMFTAVVGCQNDDEIINVQSNALKTFYATFENGAETRTALDADNNVVWSEDDQISVFAGSTANNSFILKAGANTTYGEFRVNSLSAGTESNGSTSTLSANAAYYPYGSDVTVSESNGSYTFNATFPATQTYAASGTFGNGASPMVAVTSSALDANLKFKNVGAIFRLQLVGEATVTKVEFSANASLAGDCQITATNSAAPTVNVTGGSNTIVLNCGEGVELSSDSVTNFIVAMLPVESITGGITITIYDNAGKKMVYTHKGEETITIERSKAYTTAQLTYSGEYIYTEGSIEQLLQSAAKSGGEFTLTENVTLAEPLNVTANLVLNLDGYTISGPQEGRDANNNRIHVIKNNAELTIIGGKVASVGNNAGSAIYNLEGATLTIENVEVLGAPYENNGSWPSYAINNYGDLTVKSATVKSYHGGIATGGNGVTVIDDATVDVGQGVANGITSWGLYVFEQGQLTVNAGKFENTKTDTNVNGGGYLCTSSTGETVINGGVFDNAVSTGLYVNGGSLTIKGGTFDKNVTSYVAEGYSVVDNGDGTWTVKEGKAVSTVDDLVLALSDPDVEEIVLSNDLELSSGLVFGAAATTRSTSTTISGRDIVIDGNGSTISFTAGTDSRLIDVKKETEGMNLTLKNITIENKISWVQRVINYNTYGTLTLDNVTITHADGCSANYAVNLPGVSDNCTVVINNCNIGATANALNIWGKNVKADVTDSDLYVIDNSEKESYSVIALNNDGAGSSADGTVVNVTGGSLKTTGTYAEYSDAVRNNTETGVVNISTSTEVVGEIEEMVAIVHYAGSTDYYSKQTLAGAIQTAKETNAAGIRLIRDIECDSVLLIDSNLKIEGNGHTLTTSATRAIRLTTSDITVEISNLNIVSTAPMVYPEDVRGISLDGSLKNICLTLTNCTIDFTDSSTCDWTYGVNICSNSSTYTLNINGGTYEGSNVINIWGSNHTVNIDGATLDCTYGPNDSYKGACVAFNPNSTNNTATIKNTTYKASGNNARTIWYSTDGTSNNTASEEGNTDNISTSEE